MLETAARAKNPRRFCFNPERGKSQAAALPKHQRSGKSYELLGICYRDGKGVAKDDAEAAKWVRKAAEQNFAQAQYELGVYYYDVWALITSKA